MRTGLVVDSTCDIPESFLQRNQVQILPLSVSGGESPLTDRRHKTDGLSFYQQWAARRSLKPVRNPITEHDVASALVDRWIYDFDHLLIVTPHIKLSSTLQTIRETLVLQHPNLEPLRHQAQLTLPFKVRVVESQSGLAGYGLAVYEALRLMSEKARSIDQLKTPLTAFSQRLETFVLPGNPAQQLKTEPFALSWLAAQQQQWKRQQPVFHIGHRGVTLLRSCQQATRLKEFVRLVTQRLGHMQLHNQLICVSYAGNPADLRVSSAYTELQQCVKEKQGRLLFSIMSPASASQLGYGAVSVAFAHQA